MKKKLTIMTEKENLPEKSTHIEETVIRAAEVLKSVKGDEMREMDSLMNNAEK